MRIGIDIRWLQRSSSSRSFDGISRYSFNLISNLIELDPTNDYIFFISENKEIPGIPPFEGKYRHLSARKLKKTLKLPVASWALNLAWCMLQEQVSVVPELKHHNLDIYHCMQQLDLPYGVNRCRTVVTVHDMAYALFPHFFLQNRMSRWVYQTRVGTIKKASKIIAVSKNTKKDLVKLLQIPENRIEVIPEGVEPKFCPVQDLDKIEAIKRKYNISEEYVFHVGGFSPTKNLHSLLLAFKGLVRAHREDVTLVLAGNTGSVSPYEKRVRRDIEELQLGKKVVIANAVCDNDLVLLYNGATLFVYPSLYEGFGLPPLEAMACGTPVIASTSSSLPELIGDAGILVDPHNVDEITLAMFKVLSSSQLRNEMIAKEIRRSKLFSWRNTARNTLAVYENLYKGA